MAELLESAMLICFGLSWPMNLLKNIKAKSAKTMSLQFILLIIAGYIAGICAKFYNHKFNYVLAVYLLNLAVVSANLVVYFINRHYDQQTQLMNRRLCKDLSGQSTDAAEVSGRTALASQPAPSGANVTLNPSTNSQGEDEMEKYRELNSITEAGGVVLFGSNTFASLPVGELTQAFRITEPIYNRSVRDIRLSQIETYLKVCLYDLNPRKIFVNMGDVDIQDDHINIDDFISKYEWLLYMIHTKTEGAIYIVSIISGSAAASRINERLKTLASQTGCRYIDAVGALESKRPTLRLFELLKVHMRNHPISFADAMETGTLSNREKTEVPNDRLPSPKPDMDVVYAKHHRTIG